MVVFDGSSAKTFTAVERWKRDLVKKIFEFETEMISCLALSRHD
jgi:hypothetical protein